MQYLLLSEKKHMQGMMPVQIFIMNASWALASSCIT